MPLGKVTKIVRVRQAMMAATKKDAPGRKVGLFGRMLA